MKILPSNLPGMINLASNDAYAETMGYTRMSAGFSSADVETAKYRYWLSRKWERGPYCVFIGLNPSTATFEEDDPTIRRCVGFAKRWGFGALVMLNIFAFRSTDPKKLRVKSTVDPVGPQNYAVIEKWLLDIRQINEGTPGHVHPWLVCAWGANGIYRHQGDAVLARIHALGLDAHCFEQTKNGEPIHPLYQPYSKPLVPYP